MFYFRFIYNISLRKLENELKNFIKDPNIAQLKSILNILKTRLSFWTYQFTQTNNKTANKLLPKTNRLPNLIKCELQTPLFILRIKSLQPDPQNERICKTIQTQIERADHLEKSIILNKLQPPKRPDIQLSVSYNPTLPSFKETINKCWHILSINLDYREKFNTPPLIVFLENASLKQTFGTK